MVVLGVHPLRFPHIVNVSLSATIRFRRNRFALGLAAALVALTTACAPEDPAELRVGLIGQFDGQMAGTSGLPARLGAQLAIDEINADGGVRVGGVVHRLVLIDRAVESRPDAAAVMARALINIDSVDVLIGPQTSALAIPAAAVAEASDVLMIAPMASNPAVTQGHRVVFRLAFVDAFQGAVLARFAYDSLGHRRAAVLFDAGSAYGREIAALFSQTFERLGGRVVASETFDIDGPPDHGPQIRRLIAANPDAILLPNFVTHDSAQIRRARQLGFRGRFLGSDSWDVRALSPRDDANGSIVVANWDSRSDRQASRDFLARWQARHTEVPRATAAATYDAVHLAAAAASQAGSLRGAALAEALRTRGVYEGAVSRLDFRGTNDPVRGAVILEVRPDQMWVRSTVAPPSTP